MALISGGDSGSLEGYVRVWVGGDEVFVQMYQEDPARIAPCFIPDGEVLNRTAAGEQVYLADRAWHGDLATLSEDFVLFDDQTVVWYRYDDAGRLLGHERDDRPASLERCRKARDLAVRWAVPLDEFLRSSSATMS